MLYYDLATLLGAVLTWSADNNLSTSSFETVVLTLTLLIRLIIPIFLEFGKSHQTFCNGLLMI
jgi:hypothetical protein